MSKWIVYMVGVTLRVWWVSMVFLDLSLLLSSSLSLCVYYVVSAILKATDLLFFN